MNDIYEYEFSLKRVFQWGVTNLLMLLAFAFGNLYDINWLITLGEFLAWFAAMGGIIIGLVIWLFQRSENPAVKDIKFIVVPSSFGFSRQKIKKIFEELNESYQGTLIPMEESNLQRMAYGSVPVFIDIFFDIVIVMLMLYFGYTWLPIFYILHIVGAQTLRNTAKKTLKTGDYLLLENSTEKDNTNGESL